MSEDSTNPPPPIAEPIQQAVVPPMNTGASTPYQTAPAAAKQPFSITAFVLGIGAFVLSWVPFFGFLTSLAAVIVGFVARKREPAAPQWMSLVAIILGFVGLAISVVLLALFVLAIAAGMQNMGPMTDY